MADRKIQDQDTKDGGAAPQPQEPNLQSPERLRSIELELLARLARQSEPATPGNPPPHAATPSGDERRSHGRRTPSAEADALELLRTLASHETGISEQDSVTPSAVTGTRSFDLETSIAQLADTGAAAQWARRSSRRPTSRLVTLLAIFVLSLAAVVGFTGLLWTWLSTSGSVKTRQTKPEVNIVAQMKDGPKPTAEAEIPSVQTASQVAPDFQTAQQAMKDCDAAAANDLDSIFFLVIPLKPTQGAFDSLAQRGDRYEKFALLPSKVAMAGLQDNTLALQARRYTFAAADTASSKMQKFDVTDGLSRFFWHDDSTILKFKLGFEAAELGTATNWSGEFIRVRGVCYWVYVLFKE